MKKSYIVNLLVAILFLYQGFVFASDFPIVKVSKEDKTVFLIGSIHVSTEKIESDQNLNSIVENSNGICFESDPKDEKNSQIVREKIFLNPVGTQLKERIGPMLFKKVKSKLSFDPDFSKNINLYSPFSISVQLLNTNPAIQTVNSTFQASNSLENYISNISNKKNVRIEGIEDNDSLVNSFSSISDEEWRHYLTGILEILDCNTCISNYSKFLIRS